MAKMSPYYSVVVLQELDEISDLEFPSIHETVKQVVAAKLRED